MSAFDKKEFRVLRRTGSWTMGAMRRSFRKAGKRGGKAHTSKPGEVPRYHKRGFASLKEGVFFQADLEAGGVIIGPNKLKTNVDPHGGLKSSAQLLEEGGRGTITSFRYNKPSKSGKQRPARKTRRTGKWDKRPFAEPLQKPAQEKMKEFIQTTPI